MFVSIYTRNQIERRNEMLLREKRINKENQRNHLGKLNFNQSKVTGENELKDKTMEHFAAKSETNLSSNRECCKENKTKENHEN